MGQAKRRGTFEQRVNLAQERERRLKMEMAVLPEGHPVKAAYRKVGSRKMSMMIAATLAATLPK